MKPTKIKTEFFISPLWDMQHFIFKSMRCNNTIHSQMLNNEKREFANTRRNFHKKKTEKNNKTTNTF